MPQRFTVFAWTSFMLCLAPWGAGCGNGADDASEAPTSATTGSGEETVAGMLPRGGGAMGQQGQAMPMGASGAGAPSSPAGGDPAGDTGGGAMEAAGTGGLDSMDGTDGPGTAMPGTGIEEMADTGGMSSTDGMPGSGAATMATAGCGQAPGPDGSIDIDVDGTQHRYIVLLPSSYDQNQPYPLLMAFHGAGIDAEFFQRFFSLEPVAGEEAVIVYFEAIGGQWQYNRDLPYLDAVVEEMTSLYCVDESRIFATGHSAGGYFSNAIGIERSELVRAIAPIAGGVGIRGTPSAPVAAWIGHGDMDNIVRTSEGQRARDFWVEENGCDGDRSEPVDPSQCVVYAGCADGQPVQYCEFAGDHFIPDFVPGAVWDFFKSL